MRYKYVGSGFLLTGAVTPHTRCKLKLLKLERIKDYLLMEEEYIQNQERLKPQEEKNLEERSKVDDIRGSPMGVGTLEEIIDGDSGCAGVFSAYPPSQKTTPFYLAASDLNTT